MNTRVIDWQQYAQVARNPLIWLIILLTGGLVYIFKSPSPATQPIAPPALQGSLPSGLGTIAPPVTEAPAALPAGPLETASGAGLSFAPKVFIVLLFAVIYLLAYKSWMNYPLLFVLGAVVTVYFGAQMQFYDTGLALKSLVRNLDVIFFLVGMNLVTAALALGGLFDHLGRKISSLARDDPWRIMLWFCLTTYTLSLLVNNLTTMLVLTPIILSLSRRLDLDPQPYLVGMIVASNLGGASTMIGDFPNVLSCFLSCSSICG
ncbi:MAG: hypothetical protein HY747_08230 [Elusimicrobia bacterium]|nr:hypothetical protein [Elusimicrobiota bacterium]